MDICYYGRLEKDQSWVSLAKRVKIMHNDCLRKDYDDEKNRQKKTFRETRAVSYNVKKRKLTDKEW